MRPHAGGDGRCAVQCYGQKPLQAQIAVIDLAKVTDLSVFDTELTTLAAGDLDGLSGLKHLTIDARLTSLPDLSDLVLLETLEVSYNQLTSLPDLSSNTKLTRISAGENKLASLPDLSDLVLLETLGVYGNQLTSLPDLSSNINLSYLDLGNNPLANLDSLSLTGSDGNPVSLNAAFDADTTSYTADAGSGVTSVTVTPTALDTGVLPESIADDHPAPVIYVHLQDGSPQVASGSPSPAITFLEDQTFINIQVNGRGGSSQFYSVTVNADTRNYTLTPTASAAEGSDAALTVTLGEAAPAGGLAFDVTYDYFRQRRRRRTPGRRRRR